MSRTKYMSFSLFVLALILICLVWQFPSTSEIDQGFQGLTDVVATTKKQTKVIQEQIAQVPDFDVGPVETLRDNVGVLAERAQIDIEVLSTVQHTLIQVAEGLESTTSSEGLAALQELEKGLDETARFLEDQVCKPAQVAAEEIDELASKVTENVQEISTLLEDTPIDLAKIVEGIVESLGSAEQVLGTTEEVLDTKAFTATIEVLEDYEELMDDLATVPDRLADLGIPGTPVSAKFTFWPEGKKVAATLRSTSTTMHEIGGALDKVVEGLPEIRKTVDDSKQVLVTTRGALEEVLKREEELTQFVNNTRSGIASAVETLPATLTQVSTTLRGTQRLRTVADGLRQVAAAARVAETRWTVVEQSGEAMGQTLRGFAKRIDLIVQDQSGYEEKIKNLTTWTQTRLDQTTELVKQEEELLSRFNTNLADMHAHLSQVEQTLPAYKRAITNIVVTCRVAGWFVAALLVAYGVMLLSTVRN